MKAKPTHPSKSRDLPVRKGRAKPVAAASKKHLPEAPEPRRSGKGEETRRRILDVALALFRKKGFDQTTMRDIAAAAGLALGAAYYYFPSKESIVLGYYERSQVEHLEAARAAFAATTDVRKRVRATIQTKLDLVRRDRRLLGALFRSVADPEHPLSVFSAATADVRSSSIALFEEALSVAGYPDDLARLLARSLWMLLLGLLLFLLHDTSPGQERTRRLVDGSVELVMDVMSFAALPGMAPMRARLIKLLGDAGLAG